MSHRFCLVVAILGVVAASATAGEPAKPNIIVIIADDLGWNDVGWHGSEIKTPNLDKLAKNGVVLDRHYVYPTCSPTRAGILTGRNPSRFNIHGPIAGKSELALPMDTLTISRLLQTRGYVTALIGKWHLGLRPEVGPRRFGFDFTYGYFHGQLDPLTHRYHGGEQTWHRNDQYVEEKGHVTDLIAEEAVKFIERPPGEGGRKPFFLWMAHATPHYPLTEEEKWLTPYKDTIKDSSRRLYAASITHMDDAIGRVVKALEKTKQIDNTFILFTSDNGGFEKYQSKTQYGGQYSHPKLGDNTPLRGWKGELYDGGVRVSALVHWQGKFEPGPTRDLVSMLDWYPTFARLAGADVPATAKIEGRDVWSVLIRSKEPPVEPTLYWNVGSKQAVMHDGWKLIVNAKNQKLELYDMRDEKTDQADRNRQKLVELQAVLKKQRDLDPK